MTSSLFSANGQTSEYVTTEANTAGQLTPIMVISPDDGVGLRLFNNVEMGDKTGIPIYAKLRDSGGNPVSLNTEVAIGYKRPTDKNINVVSEEWGNIQPYLSKSIQEQQDADNIDSVKHNLAGEKLDVRDIDEAYILVDGPAIDPTQSEIYLEQSAVEEVDIE